jgi:hypothetical protein
MRRLLVAGILAVASAACGPSRGELIVDWTFAGQSCADAGVAAIYFSIANETLSPDHYNCVEQGHMITGADLGDYLAGSYDVTLTGVDADGVTLYQATQTVQVRGGRQNEFAIDLAQVAVTTGSANLTWTFDGQNCAQANVDHVTILVDTDASGNGGVNAGTVACSTLGTDGASVEQLSPGNHTFAILGVRTVAGSPHLVYRTHHPPTAFIEVGLITDVRVSAESPP